MERFCHIPLLEGKEFNLSYSVEIKETEPGALGKNKDLGDVILEQQGPDRDLHCVT